MAEPDVFSALATSRGSSDLFAAGFTAGAPAPVTDNVPASKPPPPATGKKVPPPPPLKPAHRSKPAKRIPPKPKPKPQSPTKTDWATNPENPFAEAGVERVTLDDSTEIDLAVDMV